jgi:hypothetical protein
MRALPFRLWLCLYLKLLKLDLLLKNSTVVLLHLFNWIGSDYLAGNYHSLFNFWKLNFAGVKLTYLVKLHAVYCVRLL